MWYVSRWLWYCYYRKVTWSHHTPVIDWLRVVLNTPLMNEIFPMTIPWDLSRATSFLLGMILHNWNYHGSLVLERRWMNWGGCVFLKVPFLVDSMEQNDCPKADKPQGEWMNSGLIVSFRWTIPASQIKSTLPKDRKVYSPNSILIQMLQKLITFI